MSTNVPSARVHVLAMHRVFTGIRAEHRSLREVLKKMQHTALGMIGNPISHECANLGLMLQYIRRFPDSVHHQKEDLYLFAKLRQRTDDRDAVITELGRHHAGGEEWLGRLEQALTRFERGFPLAFEEFRTLLDTYGDLQCRHMQREESVILPAATRHLTVEDWEEIAAAFESNDDPRFVVDEEKRCSSLYARISRMAVRSAGPG